MDPPFLCNKNFCTNLIQQPLQDILEHLNIYLSILSILNKYAVVVNYQSYFGFDPSPPYRNIYYTGSIAECLCDTPVANGK